MILICVLLLIGNFTGLFFLGQSGKFICLHLILYYFCLMFIIFIALPLAPLNARAIMVEHTFLTISWIPRDDTDSKLRYSTDCFRCFSLQDKECRGLCRQNVKFQPGGDKIYTVNVAVFGLQAGSFYLFRVYSVNELNQQEKDRDKWNFATVYVKTKGKKSVNQCHTTACSNNNILWSLSESTLHSLSSSYSSLCYCHRRDHHHHHCR